MGQITMPVSSKETEWESYCASFANAGAGWAVDFYYVANDGTHRTISTTTSNYSHTGKYGKWYSQNVGTNSPAYYFQASTDVELHTSNKGVIEVSAGQTTSNLYGGSWGCLATVFPK